MRPKKRGFLRRAGTGAIGPRYKVRSQSITSYQKQAKMVGLPQAGRRVGQVLAAYSRPRQLPGPPVEPVRFRARGIALLLAFFLGGFGAHLFYMGYHGRGVAYLIGTLAGIFLFLIGFIASLGTIVGGGTSGLGFLTAGAVLASLIGLLYTIDIILILTNSLKPKDGEYYPRFFQTKSSTTEPTR